MTRPTVPTIDEEPTELSLQDIYQQLMLSNELILTIPEDQEPQLRKGLAMVKSKQNTKLKDSGIQPDKLTLQYHTIPHKNDKGVVIEGVVDVHVILAPRSGITVLSMKTPDDTI